MAIKEMTSEEETKRSRGPLIFGGVGLGVGIGTLVMALIKPEKAAAGTSTEPINVIVDGDVRKALAALILQGEAISNALVTANDYLEQLVNLLGGPSAAGHGLQLIPFRKASQNLQGGTSFPLYELDSGSGSLVWALIDVTDPNTTVIIKIDDLLWEFKYSTLYAEGVDHPLFPGVWLSKYDAGTSHYAFLFSAGDVKGFKFDHAFSINVRYDGSGTATLNEGRGVLWEAP